MNANRGKPAAPPGDTGDGRDGKPDGMKSTFIRMVLVGSSEILLAIGVVAIFTLLLGGALFLLFPAGTGLTSLYDELRDTAGHVRSAASRAVPDDEGSVFEAVLTGVSRRVKDRPADAVAWTAASAGMALGNRHAVQTFERSAAVISVNDSDELRLGENSLVVVRRPEPTAETGAGRGALLLLGGSLSGTFSAARAGAAALDIVTAAASGVVSSRGGSPAEVSVSVNPDSSSTFTVLSGVAQVSAAGGSALVESNYSITVAPDQPPGTPVRIPDRPLPMSPSPGAVISYSSIAPRVIFAWSPSTGAERYRLVIARDAGFADIVHDETLSRTSFTHGNLVPGNYHWRVSAVGHGIEGAPSSAAGLSIVQDLVPPRIDVDLPEVAPAGPGILVRGTTEPGAEVIVGEEAVPVSEGGSFEHTLALKPGMNLVVIEAVDAAGNSTYLSRYVNAKVQE